MITYRGKRYIFGVKISTYMLSNNDLVVLRTDLDKIMNTVEDGDTFITHKSRSNFNKIAKYYNTEAVPKLKLWNPSASITDIANKIVMSDFIALPEPNRSGWMAISRAVTINATQGGVKANFEAIFGVGTNTTKDILYVLTKPATNFEFLFTTNRICSNYGYEVSAEDIINAFRL